MPSSSNRIVVAHSAVSHSTTNNSLGAQTLVNQVIYFNPMGAAKILLPLWLAEDAQPMKLYREPMEIFIKTERSLH